MTGPADGGPEEAGGELALPGLAATVSEIFGDRAEAARSYADLLRHDAITRGLLGPAEADRVWRRHILNCAVVESLIPPGARVIDLGSGAGLPGIPLALARPDLRIVLLEPLARRSAFLTECLERLPLPTVSVHRGRAETAELPPADVVVARAVTRLERLMRLSAALLVDNGSILALKGRNVAGEVDEVTRCTGVRAEVFRLSAPDQPATVVRLSGTLTQRSPRAMGRHRRVSR